MSLMNCSECGSEVSSQAVACPKCGNPIAPASPVARPHAAKKPGAGRKIARIAGFVALGMIVLLIWASQELAPDHRDPGVTTSSGDTSSQGSASVANAAPPPPIAISADDLYAAYRANEVLADTKYKGRTLSVSGVISSISKDVMDDPYLTLQTSSNQFDTVNAYFSKGALQKLSELRKGQAVTVTCRGKGMVLTSPVLDCA